MNSLIDISLILAALCDFILGILLIKKGEKKESTYVFAEFCFWVGLWTLGIAAFRMTDSLETAFFWNRMFIFSAGMIAVSFLHFSMEFTERKLSVIRKIILYIPAPIILAGVFMPGVFIEDILIRSWGKESMLGSGYWLYGLFFFGYMLSAFLLIMSDCLKSTGMSKTRLEYILLITLPASLVGAYFNLILILLGNYRYIWAGPFSSFILVLGIAYAITKSKLMEVNMVVTRGTVFSAVYFIVLGIPFLTGILGEEYLTVYLGSLWWVFPVVIAVVIASLGPTIYGKFKNKAEWTLFKKQKKYQQTLLELGKRMTLTKNITELLALITRTVTKNVGIDYTRIFLWDKKKKEYVYEKGYGKERRRQSYLKLDGKDPVIRYLKEKREPLLREEILQISANKNRQYVRNFIRNTGAELIVPAFIKNKMMGFISLGPKKNNRIYTPEDIDMFRILAGQAALAIENAQFYEKVKESEAELVQASKMSSVGQLASGLAHNLQNPFGSIMLNNEMIGNEIEALDKLSEEETKNLLEYVESSISSARQGGELVSSIMRFSKPAGDEKKKVSISKIVEEARNLTISKFGPGINLEISIPEEPDDFMGNEIEFIQVVMNLLSNAADAVKESPQKRVFLDVEVKGGKLHIKVKDTGIGVPDDIKEKIFDHFFTTKRNAGTGLGLSFSYQIVKAHGGEITFKSREGEGSLFEVVLPLK